MKRHLTTLVALLVLLSACSNSTTPPRNGDTWDSAV